MIFSKTQKMLLFWQFLLDVAGKRTYPYFFGSDNVCQSSIQSDNFFLSRAIEYTTYYYWCFPSQINRSIRDMNLFFNETQISCSLIIIMRHVFFSGRKKIFLRFIGNFVFGVKIYFFNYSRELFFQLSITLSKTPWVSILLNL